MKPVPTFLKAFFAVAIVPVAIALSGCTDDNTTEPDGSGEAKGTLYFSSGSFTNEIYAFDIQSGDYSDVLSGQYPFITPQGRIIYVVGGDLVESDLNGGNQQTIVDGNGNDGVRYNDDFHNPQLSPQGDYIIYRGSATNELYIVERATGNLKKALFDPDGKQNNFNPSWTPDGRIMMASLKDGKEGLFILEPDFTTFTQIAVGLGNPEYLYPKVSPNGQKVAFIQNNKLQVTTLVGADKKEYAVSTSDLSHPAWSPDGKWIAVYGGNTVYLVPVAGGSIIDLESKNQPFIKNAFISKSSQMHWK